MKSKKINNAKRYIKSYLGCLFLLISPSLFAQKTELIVPAKHSKAVIAAIYSNDRKKIISIGSDQTLKIWKAKDGLLLSTIKDTLVNYESLSLLPKDGLALVRTDKGYQILDYKKNQVISSKRIPKYTGGCYVEGTSDFYYTKGFDAAPNEKALYKLFKRNVISGSAEEEITEFNDPDGRVAWTLRFTQGGQNIMVKLYGMHMYLFNTKNNALTKFENFKYGEQRADGIIEFSYKFSQLGEIIELSNYRGKNDYTVKYIDVNKAVKKSFILKNVSHYEVTNKGLFYISDRSAALYDEQNDKIVKLTVPANHRILSYDDKQNKFLVVDSKTQKKISIANAKQGNMELALGGKLLYTTGVLQNDKDYKQFWLASGYSRKYLNITDGRIHLTSNQMPKVTSSTVFPDFDKGLVREKNGDSIITYKFSNKEIGLVNAYNLKDVIQKEFSTNKPYAFCISDNGTIIALSNSKKTIVYDLLQKRLLNTYNILGEINQLCFSANNDLLFIGVDLDETIEDDKSRIICYKTRGVSTPVWEKKRWNVQKIEIEKSEPNKLKVVLAGTAKDAYQNLQGYEGFYELRAETGEIIDYTRGHILMDYNNVKITPSTKTVMYSISKYLFSLNKAGVKTIAETFDLPSGAKDSYSNFYNNEFLIYPVAAGSYAIFDLKRGQTVADLYLFDESNDWVLMTKSGRFDGTESATKALYYVRNDAKIEVDAVYEKFYTPNLLIRLLSRENLPSVDVDLDNLRPKPLVKMQYSEKKRNLEVEDDVQTYLNTSGVAEITVNATAPDDKVDEIRLFHNGKAVNLTTRGLFVTDADGFDSKKYTINLLPGTNNFRAIALNSQRTESMPDELVVNYKKDGSTPVPPKPNNDENRLVDQVDHNATLHIVVVGINAYKSKIKPLTYAIPDAKAFKEELEQDAKSIVSNIKSYLIADDQASKAGILAAFETIKKTAKPEDVFVFYYAGHGYIHPSNNEFYLVSADVADGDESLLKNGISAKQLQAIAVDIPAQKQVFIMDACQSAGAFEQMLKHDGEQQKNLALIARSTGTHWMAASGSTETAKEFGELGHGVFTYSLLQALKGKAVNNKMITVNGLKNYLREIVPELVKKYGSSGQYPASYGLGNDFPVEILK